MVQAGLESNLTARLLAYLKKYRHKAIKIHVDQYQEAGTPDIIACVRGYCLLVEVKKPGALPTKIQRLRLLEWQHAGAFTLVADNLDALKIKLDEIYKASRGEVVSE
jgi:hypothetical protein